MDLHSGSQPRLLLGVLGASAALAVVLVLSDPASQPATTTSLRATVGGAPPAASHGPVAQGAEARATPAALAADAVLTPGERQAARFAALEGTLAAAVAGSELAAARAHDVAIRAFAAHQAARYAGLRSTLDDLVGRAGRVDLAARPDAPPLAASLAALRAATGSEFDRLYVSHALELNRVLLAELDGALADIEDGELRDAVEWVRGSMDAGGAP